MTPEKLMSFINEDSNKINGWFFHQDMISIWCIDFAQKQMQVMGDLCEVGVYEGKSLIFLSNLARLDERVVGFDLFPGDMLEKAKENILKFGSGGDVNLKIGDTSRLDQRDIIQLFPSGVRMLHIDAGHEYHEVLHQLKMFVPLVSEGGCIVMDDYQDREYPGIEAAVLEFCEIDRPRRFVPFFAGANKMYLCERPMAARYQRNLMQHDVFADKSRITKVRDFNILVGFSKAPMSKQACLDALRESPYTYNSERYDSFLVLIRNLLQHAHI